jgi:hypothetical protein
MPALSMSLMENEVMLSLCFRSSFWLLSRLERVLACVSQIGANGGTYSTSVPSHLIQSFQSSRSMQAVPYALSKMLSPGSIMPRVYSTEDGTFMFLKGIVGRVRGSED